jgi:energy-coupling factor transport system substrate-specific component
MWKYSTMVALTVLCAGIYMLFLLPFKSIPIIPGITEIRPERYSRSYSAFYLVLPELGALQSAIYAETFSVLFQ